MTAADIVADEGGNAGAYMLKRWLEYCASGILEGGDKSDREPDSEFEIFVMDQIRAMGYEPVPQVGVAGYFIDIGVHHPNWPHGFVLGVECDGASYHSAKSARDRDRLRQEVLEGLDGGFTASGRPTGSMIPISNGKAAGGCGGAVETPGGR